MNDWGNEGSVPDRTKNMINAVKTFRAEGIPIDCAGWKRISTSTQHPAYDQILVAMKTYADIGVQVQITEFDIQARPSNADWNKASKIARDILQACLDSLNCTAFNNWGFSQAIYRNKRKKDDPVFMLPWNEDNEITPVYSAMRGVLQAAVMR